MRAKVEFAAAAAVRWNGASKRNLQLRIFPFLFAKTRIVSPDQTSFGADFVMEQLSVQIGPNLRDVELKSMVIWPNIGFYMLIPPSRLICEIEAARVGERHDNIHN